jgi:hypothetical protein
MRVEGIRCSCLNTFSITYKLALLFLISLKTYASVNQDFLNGGTDKKSYFYIYDWPSYLDDVWPPPNATLHAKSGYDHGFYNNRGAGDGMLSVSITLLVIHTFMCIYMCYSYMCTYVQ